MDVGNGAKILTVENIERGENFWRKCAIMSRLLSTFLLRLCIIM